MWKHLDRPRPRRNVADEWLRTSAASSTWFVQCVLSTRKPFGTVTVTTSSCHQAADEDDAKLQGMRSAARSWPNHHVDVVTAKRVEAN